ncbi:MAG TPA: flagellar basal body protein, partial [Bryobacteraceae bacterium]|nr:flagellar basal body protein [Bryobacteraceae bacterium]
AQYFQHLTGLRFWNHICVSDGVTDAVSTSLERYMDLISMRQKLVSSNIANADTPGYKTQDIDFQASLKSLLDGGSPQQGEVQGLAVKNDGNNVDLDREAQLLSENALRFSVASSLMKMQLQSIRSAIKEGANA